MQPIMVAEIFRQQTAGIQGGSIIPLLRFGGTFFRIGSRFKNNFNMIVICVILSVYGVNSITNSACVVKGCGMAAVAAPKICRER